MYTNFDIEEFEGCRKYYPRWTGRRDKVRLAFLLNRRDQIDKKPQQGLPVYVYPIASLVGPVQRDLEAISPERRYQRMCVPPHSSPH